MAAPRTAEKIQALLAQAKGKFFAAIQNGSVADLEGILTHALENNFRDKLLDEKNQDGLTGILLAARFGKIEHAKKLIAHGAKVDQDRAQGETVLEVARRFDQVEFAEFLLDRNARLVFNDDIVMLILEYADKKNLFYSDLKLPIQIPLYNTCLDDAIRSLQPRMTALFLNVPGTSSSIPWIERQKYKEYESEDRRKRRAFTSEVATMILKDARFPNALQCVFVEPLNVLPGKDVQHCDFTVLRNEEVQEHYSYTSKRDVFHHDLPPKKSEHFSHASFQCCGRLLATYGDLKLDRDSFSPVHHAARDLRPQLLYWLGSRCSMTEEHKETKVMPIMLAAANNPLDSKTERAISTTHFEWPSESYHGERPSARQMDEEVFRFTQKLNAKPPHPFLVPQGGMDYHLTMTILESPSGHNLADSWNNGMVPIATRCLELRQTRTLSNLFFRWLLAHRGLESYVLPAFQRRTLNVNQTDLDENSMLYWAVRDQKNELVGFLVKANANAFLRNAKDQPLLFRLAKEKLFPFCSIHDTSRKPVHLPEMLERVAERDLNYAENGETLLTLALQQGNFSAAYFLVRAGINLEHVRNIPCPKEVAFEKHALVPSLIIYAYSYVSSERPEESLNMARQLIKYREIEALVNFFQARHRERLPDDVFKQFQASSDLVNARDENGHTLLRWAMCKGFEDVTNSLLDAKANPHLKNNRGQPLLWEMAELGKFPGRLESILQTMPKQDLNFTERDETFLMLALKHRNCVAAGLFIGHGLSLEPLNAIRGVEARQKELFKTFVNDEVLAPTLLEDRLIYSKNECGQPMLFELAECGKLPDDKKLEDTLAKFPADQIDDLNYAHFSETRFENLITLALKHRQYSQAAILLEYGVSPEYAKNRRDFPKNAFFHVACVACRRNSFESIKKLVPFIPRIQEPFVLDEYNCTLLMRAAYAKDSRIFSCLYLHLSNSTLPAVFFKYLHRVENGSFRNFADILIHAKHYALVEQLAKGSVAQNILCTREFISSCFVRMQHLKEKDEPVEAQKLEKLIGICRAITPLEFPRITYPESKDEPQETCDEPGSVSSSSKFSKPFVAFGRAVASVFERKRKPEDDIDTAKVPLIAAGSPQVSAAPSAPPPAPASEAVSIPSTTSQMIDSLAAASAAFAPVYPSVQIEGLSQPAAVSVSQSHAAVFSTPLSTDAVEGLPSQSVGAVVSAPSPSAPPP